jgi:mono/diheme cytochrome c family protein
MNLMQPTRTPSTHAARPAVRAALLLLVAASLLMAGCAQTGQMVDQSRYDPLEASAFFADGASARAFPPNTVSYQGADSDPDSPARTGLDEAGQPVTAIPVVIDAALVQEGQERYTIFCATCHGADGAGNGRATTFGFPKPPPLQDMNLTDGQVFNIITNGQGLMYPYGYRVKPDERWAVIAYIRALRLKGGAVNAADLTPEEINQLGTQP